METIRSEKDEGAMLRRMQERYRTQDVDALYDMIHKEGGEIAKEEERFLNHRNRNWVPQIIEMISEKKTFIAVGAGHLGGPNGLIRLLEKEGYTLEPVSL